MINVISMSVGDGSHYSENGIYPKSSSIITKADNSPAVILGQLQKVYQLKLDELLAG